jgi:hypothetical protein
MKKIGRTLRKILAPAVIVAIAFAMSFLTPAAAIGNTLRTKLYAAGTELLTASVDEAGKKFTVSGLPPKMSKVGQNLADIKVFVDADKDGIYNNSDTLGDLRIFHAGQIYNDQDGKYKYDGSYEYRFYATVDDDDAQYFDSYTVTVTKDDYKFVMPTNSENIMSKTIPSTETAVVFPLPAELNVIKNDKTINLLDKDDKDNLENLNAFFAEYADEFPSAPYTDVDAARAALISAIKVMVKPNTLDPKSAVSFAANNTATYTLQTPRPTTLQVSYELQVGGAVLTSLPLSDISIRVIDKNNVIFGAKPTASKGNLNLGVESKLSAPTVSAPTIKNNTTQTLPAPEAYTQIVSVRYAGSKENLANKNDDTVVYNSNITGLTGDVTKDSAEGKAIVEFNGLTVTAHKIGWYEFTYRTTTVWGYTNKLGDAENETVASYIDYIPFDATEVRYSTSTTQLKWTDSYTGASYKYDDYDDAEDFAKYLPNKTQSDSKTTVTRADGIVFPALVAKNTYLAADKLEYRLTIRKLDADGTNSVDSVTLNSAAETNKYTPSNKLWITFGKSNAEGSVTPPAGTGIYDVKYGWNGEGGSSDRKGAFLYDTELGKLPGKYSVSAYVYARLRPDDSMTNLASLGTYYFEVKDAMTNTVPEIGDFDITSSKYTIEGSTLSFGVPTVTDDYTNTAEMEIKYYLNTVDDANLIEEEPVNGKLTIDLDNYTYNHNADNTIIVVANGFNEKQKVLYSGFTMTDTATKSVTFGIYDNINGQVTFEFDGIEKPTNADAANKEDFGAELAIQNDGNDTLAQNEKILLPVIKTTFAPDADSTISVSVFKIDEEDDGRHIKTNVYTDKDDVPELQNVKRFTGKASIEDWYFTPTDGGVYFILLKTKANASNTQFYFIACVDIKAKGSANVTFTNGTSTLAVGQTGTIPNVVLTVIGDKIIGSNGTLKRTDTDPGVDTILGTDDDTTIVKAVGTYTISGYSGPNTDELMGNSFTPSVAGVYKFEYDFKFNDVADAGDRYSACDGGTDSDSKPLKRTYIITVTELTEDDIQIKMGEAYASFPSGGAAISLNDFLTYNVGGTASFSVTDADLESKILDDNGTPGDSTDDFYKNKKIAIPMPKATAHNLQLPNPQDITFDIKVQKSGEINNDGSPKYLLDTASDKDELKDKVGDFYVFQPDGRFKEIQSTGKYTEMEGYEDDASGLYIVTYTMNNGMTSTSKTLEFNITVGDLEPSAIELGDIAKKDNAEADAAYTYKVGNKVTLDMSKITVTGNKKMLNFMGEWVNSDSSMQNDPVLTDKKDEEKTEEEKTARAKYTKQYIGRNMTVVVLKDGNFYRASSNYTATEKEQLDNNIANDPSIGYEDQQYSFTPTEAGTYKITFTLYNKYTGKSVSSDATLTVEAEETDSKKIIDPSNVWGIILIVLSSGLLIGVVFYFIKTGRDTKFAGAPRPEEKVKKDKPVKDKKKTAGSETEEKKE